MIPDAILNDDGTVTYWSVYHQTWETTDNPPMRELAAMGKNERDMVCAHLKKHGRG